jgi:hypothetical protein
VAYLVTIGYVTVETAIPGGRALRDVRRDATLPDDVPAEQVQRLLVLGHITPVGDPDEPPAPTGDVDQVPTGDLALVEQVPAGSVGDVLAWVGDDLERATAALTAEQARGVPARSTLVAALGKLATVEE